MPLLLLRAAAAVVAVALVAASGCSDPPPPPNAGQFIIGIRTLLPSEPDPVLSGGMGETLEGLTRFTATVSRIDVVHRTAVDDPTTEAVITVDDEEHELEFLTDIEDPSPRLFAFLNVPAGWVFQVRLIVTRARLELRGENHEVKIPSGVQTGRKIVPIDDVPFAVVAADRTAARVVFEPFKQFIRNHGEGFTMKPVLEAEHVSLAELSPILLDRVVVGFMPGVDRATIDAINAEIGTSVMGAWEPTNYYIMHLSTSVTLEDALAFYYDRDEVDYTLPDTLVFDRSHPCDPGYQNPGPFTLAKFPGAWDLTVGSRLRRVAVIDTGFNLKHPELLDNWHLNRLEFNGPMSSECIDATSGDLDGDGVVGTFSDLRRYFKAQVPGCTILDLDGDGELTPLDLMGQGFVNGLSEDFNTYADDLFGWDFGRFGNDVHYDDYIGRHGTQVAGIVGARASLDACTADDGVAGASWRTSIIPIALADPTLKTFADIGKTRSAVVRAINYAATVRADVINVSAGLVVTKGPLSAAQKSLETCTAETVSNIGDKFDKFRDASIKEIRNLALDWPGGAGSSLLVVAAPNCPFALDVETDAFDVVSGGRDPSQPIVIVGGLATDFSQYKFSPLSARGDEHIDIAAPSDHFNVLEGASFTQAAGNSYAAPLVSGAAALMVSKDSTLHGKADRIKQRLLCNADHRDELTSEVLDGSVLNAYDAVGNLKQCP